MRKIILFLFCMYSLFFVLGSTLAPIMAHYHQYNFSGYLTSLYIHACHQQPDRSFWFFGYPVALCCRCYGFYLGTFFSSIVAFLNKLKLNFKMVIGLFLLTLVDIVLNFIFNINTGNYIRFLIGLIMGLLFIFILCCLLKFLKERLNNAH